MTTIYNDPKDEAMRYIYLEYCPPNVRVDYETGVELPIDDWSEFERIGYTSFWASVASDELATWNSELRFLEQHAKETPEDDLIRIVNRAFIHWHAYSIANRKAHYVDSWRREQQY